MPADLVERQVLHGYPIVNRIVPARGDSSGGTAFQVARMCLCISAGVGIGGIVNGDITRI